MLFHLIPTTHRAKSIPLISNIKVAGSSIPLSNNAKSLDKTIAFDTHVSNLQIMFLLHSHTPSYSSILNQWRCQTNHLLPQWLPTLLSKFDVICVSLRNIQRLQRIQSTLVRVVTCKIGRISISRTLKDLHSLPVKWGINIEVATLNYKVLESSEPSHLFSWITNLHRHSSLHTPVFVRHSIAGGSFTKN